MQCAVGGSVSEPKRFLVSCSESWRAAASLGEAQRVLERPSEWEERGEIGDGE